MKKLIYAFTGKASHLLFLLTQGKEEKCKTQNPLPILKCDHKWIIDKKKKFAYCSKCMCCTLNNKQYTKEEYFTKFMTISEKDNLRHKKIQNYTYFVYLIYFLCILIIIITLFS